MTNLWNIGINVMIQMDSAEFFVGICRGFADIFPTWLIAISFTGMNFCWMYFRLFSYISEVLIQGSMFGRWSVDYSTSHQTVLQILLMLLLALNVYWQTLFVIMFYGLVTKGDRTNLQNPDEKVKKNESSLKVLS
jgi:hypothetical protein